MKKYFVVFVMLYMFFFSNHVLSQQNDTSSYFPLGLWGVYIDQFNKPYQADFSAYEWNKEKTNWTNINGNYLDCFIPDWKEDTVMKLCEEIGYKMSVTRRKWNWDAGQFGTDTCLEYHIKYQYTTPEATWRSIADRKIAGIYNQFGSRSGFYSWYLAHEWPVVNYWGVYDSVLMMSDSAKCVENYWPRLNYIAGKIKQFDNQRRIHVVGDIQHNFLDVVSNIDVVEPDYYPFMRSMSSIRSVQCTALNNLISYLDKISKKIAGKTQEWYMIIQAQHEYPLSNVYKKRRTTLEELKV